MFSTLVKVAGGATLMFALATDAAVLRAPPPYLATRELASHGVPADAILWPLKNGVHPPAKRSLLKRVPEVGYTYDGCFTEATGVRALSGNTYYDDLMTVEDCAIACSSFSKFGLEFHRECFCGSSLNDGSVKVDETECSFPCPGDANQKCGASNRLNVYSNLPPAPIDPTISVRTYTSQGCFKDPMGSGGSRALTGKTFNDDAMTVEKCAAGCAGYSYFGLEYFHECYCSNAKTTGTTELAIEHCGYACDGDNTEMCGGDWALNLYSFDAPTTTSTTAPVSTGPVAPPLFVADGCYTDSPASRALGGAVLFDDGMTIAKCSALCSRFEIFGLEYGRECYCGNELRGGSVTADASDCSFACAGNFGEICGAGDRLNIYRKYVAPAVTTTTTTSASPTPTDCAVVAKPNQLDNTCGARGEAQSYASLFKQLLGPEYVTPEVCAQLCSITANCASILVGHYGGENWFCGLQSTAIEPGSLRLDDTVWFRSWNVDCFECSAPPTVSTTSSITSTTTTESTTSPTPTACAADSFIEGPTCGVIGTIKTGLYLGGSRTEPEFTTVKGCKQYCAQTEGCASILVGILDYKFCTLGMARLDAIGYDLDPSSYYAGYNLDCFHCVEDSASTISSVTSTTTTESTTTTTVPAVPTPTACVVIAKSDVQAATCGVVGYVQTAEYFLDLVSGVDVTADSCAQLCSITATCAGFHYGIYDWGGGFCRLSSRAIDALEFVVDSASTYGTWNMDCYECAAPSTASTTSSVTSITTTETTTTTAVPTPTDCVVIAKPNQPEATCGAVGYIRNNEYLLDIVTGLDVTADSCAQLCSITAACIAFHFGQYGNGKFCRLSSGAKDVLDFALDPTSHYGTWSMDCYQCAATASTTSSVTSTTTTESTASLASPTPTDCVLVAKSSIPTDTCGAVGTYQNNAYVISTDTGDEFTLDACLQLCSTTANCVAFNYGMFGDHPFCRLQSGILEVLDFTLNPGSYFGSWNLDCFECAAPSTASTTSSTTSEATATTSATTTESTTSTVPTPTATCAARSSPLGQDYVCGSPGGYTNQHAYLTERATSVSQTPESCAQFCHETTNCASFDLVEYDGPSFVCLLFSGSVNDIGFNADSASIFTAWDLGCFDCAVPSTAATTTTTTTESITSSTTSESSSASSTTTAESTTSSTTTELPASSTPTTCTTNPATIEDSFCGRRGFLTEQINHINELIGAYTSEECAQACSEQEGCNSFMIGTVGMDFGPQSFCELRSAIQESAGWHSTPDTNYYVYEMGCFVCGAPSTATSTTSSFTSTTSSESSTSTTTEASTTTTTTEEPTTTSTTTEVTTTTTTEEPTTTSTTTEATTTEATTTSTTTEATTTTTTTTEEPTTTSTTTVAPTTTTTTLTTFSTVTTTSTTTTTSDVPAPTNLLLNPSFEVANQADWVMYDPAGHATYDWKSSVAPRAGSTSATILWDINSENESTTFGQPFPVKAGKKYTLTYWHKIKNTTTKKCYTYASFVKSTNSNVLKGGSIVDFDDTYTKTTLVYTVPASDTRTSARVWIRSTCATTDTETTTIYYDDFKLVES